VAEYGCCEFDTALGRCAIAWSARGVRAVALPGAVPARLRRRAPGACAGPPPAAIAAVVAGLRALLRGEAGDLGAAPLDLGGVAPFRRRVYAAARAIPRGATATYGELAARIGAPGEARAVGEALARNPVPLLVPCHRVTAAGGKLGGFSGPGGAATKLRLLRIEGAHGSAQGELFEPGRFARRKILQVRAPGRV
jgi:methylated-DNA-[protein]-cysteine S-methyltransferase